MLMITKKPGHPVQMLFMNWKILENYEMYLDEVEIPLLALNSFSDMQNTYTSLLQNFRINFESESWSSFTETKDQVLKDLVEYQIIPSIIQETITQHFRIHEHGTIFIIFDPISELTELEMENDPTIVLETDRNRYATQTNYIRSALSGLFNPFDEELSRERENILQNTPHIPGELSPCFIIYNSNDNIYGGHDFLDAKESFTNDDYKKCEHWIDGYFDLNGTFYGKIKAYNNEISSYVISPRVKLKAKIGIITLKVAFWEPNRNLSIMPLDMWKLYEKKSETYGGLTIYRDGFRVLPYGRTDFDFLGFEENRSKGAGYYYFSHRKMFGCIEISKNENPKLIDKSGREGLVSNEAYRAMRSMLKDFFLEIAIRYFGTASENRKEFKNSQDQKKRQEQLIKEERKRNKEQLVLLQRQLKTQQKNLDSVEKEIKELRIQLDERIQMKKLYKTEERELLAQINNLQLKIIEAKPTLNPNITFEGNDSILDLYHSYEEQREQLETSLTSLTTTVMNNIYKNGLEEEYRTKYEDISRQIEQQIHICEKNLDDVIFQIRSNVNSKIHKLKERLNTLSPNFIQLDSISENETRRRILALNNQYSDLLGFTDQYLNHYIQALSSVDIDGQDQSLLEAYKSKEIELSQKMDVFYEIAQVGLSIDVIDHQFNVLYSEISKGLAYLSSKTKSDPDLSEICNSIKMSFQHMESNQKMLMPFYRATRRTRKEITGTDIKKTLLNFYDAAMEKAGISFDCTTAFCEYSYYSYESMLLPVFINIINNALYWVGFAENKVIRIDIAGDDTLIMNSGPQMSFTETERCFEIFYTKKPSGRGIGLYLAKRNLNSIDMDIYATNDSKYNQLGGACFVITKLHGDE